MDKDFLIDRLIALCKRFHPDPMQGRFFVAEKSTLNEQYLYQILAGKSSSTEKRSIGLNARGKLTKAFPDWLDNPDQATHSGRDVHSVKAIPKRVRPMVQSICILIEQVDDSGLEALLPVVSSFVKSHPISRPDKRKAS